MKGNPQAVEVYYAILYGMRGAHASETTAALRFTISCMSDLSAPLAQILRSAQDDGWGAVCLINNHNSRIINQQDALARQRSFARLRMTVGDGLLALSPFPVP